MDCVSDIYNTTNENIKNHPFIKRIYQNETNRTNSSNSSNPALLITFGFQNKFFHWYPELIGTANVLCLRDPNGFLFYKGIDGKSKQDDLEIFLRTEIATLKPSQVILVGSCIHGILALILGFKLQADQIITFSPWTYVTEESATCADAMGNRIILLVHTALTNEMKINENFRNFISIFDINKWKDQIGKSKVLLFHNESQFDMDALKHIDKDLVSKFTVIKVPGAKTNSETVKGAKVFLKAF